MNVREYFSEADKLHMVNAIRAAEYATSGEIRVHIEKKSRIDPLDRAAYLFQKFEMHKTNLRNGVLFYIALEDRKFAVVGDAGINQKVPEGFWNNVYDLVTGYFKKGQFADGIAEGVLLAGNQLKEHFPYDKESDKNELSDEISFGEK